ncbi:hypothetical protein V6C53_04975 [Desulfocurvibacter africanus]|uniref:hypothetical protein n=1 Tax=Desulfocurvibacter africanus TaxID=873 RepID=UPI002FDB0B95
MLVPLQQWVCDSCGGIIEKPEDGWLEWLHKKEGLGYHGFRIVHHASASPRAPHRNCYTYNDRRELLMDGHLHWYVGECGLPSLLSKLEIGKYHSKEPLCMIGDMRNYIDTMRRLLIPYYEEARLYLDEAWAEEYSGTNEIGLYAPETLKRIIEEYAGRD